MGRVIAILGIVLLVAVACAPTPAPGQQAAADQPVAGGRIVEGAISDVKTLQPVISTDTASSGAWSLVYTTHGSGTGLITINPDTGDIEPGMAERFTQSPDGLTITFELRDGLVWSDGTPFTMEDYRYTAMSVLRSKKTVRRSAFDNVDGAKDFTAGKIDDVPGLVVGDNGKKLTIKLTKPFCPAFLGLAGAGAGGILPRHHFIKEYDPQKDKDKTIDDHSLNTKPPASIGPFVFKEFRPGDRITFTRNEKFWRGAPLIEEYIIKVYADTTAIKAALLTGEVDYNTASPQDVAELQRADHLKFFRFASRVYDYIGWNGKAAKAPWLADKRVRQALWHGLNIDQLIEKVYLGFAKRQFAHSPHGTWYHDLEGLNKYAYDAAKAKQLLEQAGAKMGSDGIYRWTDGKPMRMRIETNQGNLVREQILTIAQEQYKQIGIQIEPLLESFPALLDRTDPGTDFEAFIIGWSLGIDPNPYSIWHSSQRGKNQFNNVEYVNPEVDKALELNRDGPDCSKEARKKQLKVIDTHLNADAPYTFIANRDTLLFANKRIQNFDPKPFSTGSAWNIAKWWIKQ